MWNVFDPKSGAGWSDSIILNLLNITSFYQFVSGIFLTIYKSKQWIHGGHYWLSILLTYYWKKEKNLTQTRENLIHIQVQEGHYQCRIRQQDCKHRHITTYDLTELIRIKHVTNHDIRYKQLPFETVRSIHKLKLTRRNRGQGEDKSKKAYQKITQPMGDILENLRILPCIPKKGI